MFIIYKYKDFVACKIKITTFVQVSMKLKLTWHSIRTYLVAKKMLTIITKSSKMSKLLARLKI